jgi:hypothetical protein
MTTKRTNMSKAPKSVPSPEAFWDRFLEYVEDVKGTPIRVHDFVGKDGMSAHREKERPLTIEGFENHVCDFYGISTIQQYLENREGRYTDYLSVVERVRRKIRQDQIEGGMAGIYHPNLTARINGISDKINDEGVKNVKLLSIDPL